MAITHTKADGTVLGEIEATVYALEAARDSLKANGPFWALAIEEARRSGLDCIILHGTDRTGKDPMAARFFVEREVEKGSKDRPYAALCTQFRFFWFDVVRPGERLAYGADHWTPQAD